MAILKKLSISKQTMQAITQEELIDSTIDQKENLLSIEHKNYYLIGKTTDLTSRIYISYEKEKEFKLAKKERGDYPTKKLSLSNVHLLTHYPEEINLILDYIKYFDERDSKHTIRKKLHGFYIFLKQKKLLDIKMTSMLTINNEIENLIYNEIDEYNISKNDKDSLRCFFGHLESIIPTFNAINYFDRPKSSSIKALPSEVIYQIEYYAILEIDTIIQNSKDYNAWMKEFEAINLFSLANLIRTSIHNIEHNQYHKNNKIYKISEKLYNISLSDFNKRQKRKKYKPTEEDKKLIELSEDGIVINITSERMYAFWHKELFPDYLLDKSITNEYASIFGKDYIRSIYFNAFNRKYEEFTKKFIPTYNEIYPLYILLLIREGLNIDVLNQFKITEKNEKFILGDESPLCISISSFKGRGNKKLLISIDNNSIQKKYIDFYLKWLAKIYTNSKKNNFFQYYNVNSYGNSRSKNQFITIDSNTLTHIAVSKYSIYAKYKIYDRQGHRVKRIDHRRIRPYSNYADHLRGYSNFVRQIKKGHNKIDTQTHYENNTEWKNQKICNIAKTQELLVNIFKGKVYKEDHFAVKLFEPGLFADCSNTKEPTFYGAKKLKENENCTNWKKCLTQCDKACVIPKVHGKTIYAWIQYMKEEKEYFLRESDWEKEYLLDYQAANIVFNDFTEEEKEYSIKNVPKYKEIVRRKFS